MTKVLEDLTLINHKLAVAILLPSGQFLTSDAQNAEKIAVEKEFLQIMQRNFDAF